MKACCDAVVIGSGVGGLTAAVALARAGQRVVVLEQHYLPGGWTQSFSLDGYRFSPGVHYIGELGPNGGMRRLFEGLGVARDIPFLELAPDGFDHFLIANRRFDQPKGLSNWRSRLAASFPHEREGLDRYFTTLEKLVDDVRRCDRLFAFPAVLAVPFRAPALLWWGFRTVASLLDSCIRDPALKGVLAVQCGNHGLAPSRASLPAHAVMSSHYWDGGFYPKGGAKKIPQALIKELRRRGGSIRVRTRVARILLESGRAAGVELESGEIIRASHVVSNADPALTYGKLLAKEACPSELRKIRRSEWSVSTLSAFCVVDMDLRAYDSGNYWWFRDADVGALYERMERSLPKDEIEGLFLSITTLKDPGHAPNGRHTIEMFTFVPYAPFERWQNTTSRSNVYTELKRDLGTKLLAAAEHVIPGIRRHVKLFEVGTPLTNDFYCQSFRGAAYGTAKTRWQLGPFSFNQRGPIDGLHLCGASTISHGVAGAMTSGVVAAQHVLGASCVDDVLASPDGSLDIQRSEAPRVEKVRRSAEA